MSRYLPYCPDQAELLRRVPRISWTGPSLLLRSFGCGAAGPEPVPCQLRGGRWPTLPPFASVKGMAVWLLPGTEQFSASGAAHPRRSGFPVPVRRSAARLLGAERVSQAASGSHQRLFYTSAGAGAQDGHAAVGNRSCGYNAREGLGFGGQDRVGEASAAGPDTAEGTQLAEGLRCGRQQRRRGHTVGRCWPSG